MRNRLMGMMMGVVLALAETGTSAGEVTADLTDGGIRVKIDGKVFTEYVGKGAQRPYLYPLVGPSGANLARPYPMEKGGAEDHPHHRSFWFAHGAVNGVDFWADGEEHGKQVHLGVSGVEMGEGKVSFLANTVWVSAKGEKMLEDSRRVEVVALEGGGAAGGLCDHAEGESGGGGVWRHERGDVCVADGPEFEHRRGGGAGAFGEQ